MKNTEVSRFEQRLDSLFIKIGSIATEMELQSHFARYLCVLSSGYLETSVRAILGEYAVTSSSPNVGRFVASRLKRIQNPNMTQILDVIGAFNPEWRNKMEAATEGALKAAVDSIVTNRNHIAHGKDVGIGYVTIKRYYERAKKVVQLLEEECSR